jgi:hypothetical protein
MRIGTVLVAGRHRGGVAVAKAFVQLPVSSGDFSMATDTIGSMDRHPARRRPELVGWLGGSGHRLPVASSPRPQVPLTDARVRNAHQRALASVAETKARPRRPVRCSIPLSIVAFGPALREGRQRVGRPRLLLCARGDHLRVVHGAIWTGLRPDLAAGEREADDRPLD